MKIMIEVSGGTVCNITATKDCDIYLIDHDNIKERGLGNPEDLQELKTALHPDCITNEGGHIAQPGGSETPIFDGYMDEALEEYED